LYLKVQSPNELLEIEQQQVVNLKTHFEIQNQMKNLVFGK